MAMYINTNVPSLTAQRYLGQTNNAISKSLERLSSGLRINHASDDASGLAISEKLRGQISGLKRASLNAQDGISLLQTAEGGLQNIQDMLQRMRELAVQAGNGVYTTNDRAEIQKEVDQLKEEINRISSATEFNTKKLLNGDSTALWSSDSADLDVIVKSKVAEGNYNLNVTVDPGKNFVYKTGVMALSEGAIGAEIITSTGDANETGVAFVADPNTMPSTGTSYFTVTVDVAAVTTSTLTTMSYYQQAGSQFLVTGLTASGTNLSGYIEIEAVDGFTAGSSTDGNFRARFVNAKTGDVSEWATVSAVATTGALVLGMSGLETLVGADLGDLEVTLNISGSGTIQAGDKVLFSLTASSAATGSGGGTIQISGGPSNLAGPTIAYTAESTLVKADNGDSVTDYNNVIVYYAQLNTETGNLDVGDFTMSFEELTSLEGGSTEGQTLTGDFTLQILGGGDAAASTTKLKDIARFTTDDGRNLFDTTQSLTIFGNGTSATIYLEANDTISDFETKLTNAIVTGLGMGATSGTSDEATSVNNNLVNYVSSGDDKDNTNEALEGTFVIQSALLGSDSKLSFIGDQALVDAFSLISIQDGENSELAVKVTDAHTGKAIGSDKVSDFMLRDVIKGVDVEIGSNVGIDISWDEANKKLSFSATGESEDIKLHLVDNAMKMQIGANEGQTILANIPQINTTSLGIDDVLMVDQDLAQKSITKLDKALETVSGVRATIGAQINRLDYTMTGLDTTRENLTAAESRIRDLDIADEMAEFTKNQILSQSNVAMLSQANALPQLALSLIG
jgi:flagellin